MQRFITIVKSMTEEKNEKLKSLIRFHSDKKLTTATEGGGGKGGGEKTPTNLQNKSKHKKINVFLESLLSESFPSLRVTVHLTSLGCPPTLCWSLDLL